VSLLKAPQVRLVIELFATGLTLNEYVFVMGILLSLQVMRLLKRCAAGLALERSVWCNSLINKRHNG
jgi:hypothetical protein